MSEEAPDLSDWLDQGRAFTWDELKSAIAAKTQIYRTREMQLEMRRVTKALKSEWRSIEDYLLHKVFAIDASATDADGRRCCDRASASGRRLVDNDFPYWFEEGIEHKLLWSAGGALSAAEVDAELNASLSADLDRIWMLNSIAAQSVRGLWHVHVFIRRKAENEAQAHHQRRREVVDVEAASNTNESGGEGNAMSSSVAAAT
jgi:hypothetical protein